MEEITCDKCGMRNIPSYPCINCGYDPKAKPTGGSSDKSGK